MPHITKYIRRHGKYEHLAPPPSLTDSAVERIIAAILGRIGNPQPGGGPGLSPDEIAGATVQALDPLLRVDLPLEIDKVVRRAIEEYQSNRPSEAPTRGMAENERIELSRLILSRLSAEWATLAEKPMNEAEVERIAQAVASRVTPAAMTEPMALPPPGKQVEEPAARAGDETIMVERVADAVAKRVGEPGLSDEDLSRLADEVAKRVASAADNVIRFRQEPGQPGGAIPEMVPAPGYISDESAARVADLAARKIAEMKGIGVPEDFVDRVAEGMATRITVGALNDLKRELAPPSLEDLRLLVRAEVRDALKAMPPAVDVRSAVAQAMNAAAASRPTMKIERPVDPVKMMTDVSERLRIAQAKHAEAVRKSILKAVRTQLKKTLPSLVGKRNGKIDVEKLGAEVADRVRKSVAKAQESLPAVVRQSVRSSMPVAPTPREYRERLESLVRASLKAAGARVKLKKSAVDRLSGSLWRQIEEGLPELQVVTQPAWKTLKKLLPSIVAEAVRKSSPRLKAPELDTAPIAGAISRRLSKVLNAMPGVIRSTVEKSMPAELPKIVRQAVRASMPVPPTPKQYREKLESLVRSSLRKASGRVKLRKPALERLTGSLWKQIEEGLPELQVVTQPAWKALKKMLPAIVAESVRKGVPRGPKQAAELDTAPIAQAISRRLTKTLNTMPGVIRSAVMKGMPAEGAKLDTARVTQAISRRLTKTLNHMPGSIRTAVRRSMPKEIRLRGASLDRMVSQLSKELHKLFSPAPKGSDGATKVRERVLSEVVRILPELVRNSVDRAFDTKLRMVSREIGVPPPKESTIVRKSAPAKEK